ncbi:head-to-tail adaptor [Mycobacterium phage Kalnoky]|uniref:Head-to-tail adaptor n=1 Tax=Mycobacterium phage PurpleHaze TaxID=1983577 RepID=A0A220NRS6_9CAUD|nr:head-tail adaptor Ad1 [Mycobacterium phage Purple Haze]AVJ50764.1 head-to-tail adaptor [Mycobacterium phage OlanP]AXC35125.1 head-to-tail adaptor [Mycobacterium phage Phranny]AXH44066.1 head-to-tail adaptor [Mycobacterium phage Kalnoky]AXH44474.1 head-to-tail adaptor [Mycobacterium phage Marius]AXH44796.1 head-to-tail adaptor [Mycobacterium phage Reba]AZF96788.1 head-to-tail adaptor [Mycobacterium Phage Kalb97]AZV00508.1 head-to-tail adaptor [Mycobacterium phage ACFishhook]QAY02947.1 hea
MPYATASDVTARWARQPTDEETALINVRLADVERMIKRRIPDLATRVTDSDYLEDLKQVEADAVLRLVRNPEGYLSETDGNYTYMLRSDLASGKLEIFPEEWEILGYRRSRMTVIVPNPVMPT